MLSQVILFSIKNKLIVALATVSLILFGGYSLASLTIDAVPDITDNQVQIITTSPSLAAQEVERLITFPIETAVATIHDIDVVRSFSRFGLSVVTVIFKDHVDIYWARQQISERLESVKKDIPKEVGDPYMAPITTGLGEIYQYTVRTKEGYEGKYSLMDLRTLQDWVIRRHILGTPGVADVSGFGGFVKQYVVEVHPEKLLSAGVHMVDVFHAIEKNNQNTGGAYIEKKANAYFIRTEGLAETIADIESMVVRESPSTVPILVKDVATVKLGSAVRYGAMTRNGSNEVVGGIVLMLKGENSVQVISRVKEKIDEIQASLPEGVIIEPFLDREELVNRSISTVQTNLIEGALIVIFVLILFLGNWRAGLIVASVIPLAMLFAITMMKAVGISGNLMSLGAIDFGLIVDGALIVVESVVSRLAGYISSKKSKGQILTRELIDNLVYQATNRIRKSAAFGEIIILIVYLPLLTLVGIEGKMFRPMAATVSFAILGAFILSITYVPMMNALFLNQKSFSRWRISEAIIPFFQKIYDPILSFALRQGRMVIFLLLILLITSLAVFYRMGTEFLPILDEGDMCIGITAMTGSSLTESLEITKKASRIIKENFPEVIELVGRTGSGEIPTDPMPIEATDLVVVLKDREEWVTAKTREALAEKMVDALSVIPGVLFSIQQPIQMRFNELMTGSKQDVSINLYGDDLQILSQKADEVKRLTSRVEGAKDVYAEKIIGLSQIVIDIDRQALARYGATVNDVNQAVHMAFAGDVAGMVYEGEKQFDLVVRMDEKSRKSIEDVRNLYISLPSHGDQIPISVVSRIEMRPGPVQIQREHGKRKIAVAFNVRDRDVESIVKEIKEQVERLVKLPPGYYITYGGQFENLVKARERLLVAVPLALLLIFTLLFFTFRSVVQSLLIFTAVPLSAIGGVFALFLRDMPFSISASVGFIALFGVSVLNGIVLLGEFNYLKEEGITNIKERIRKGTAARLRPVLMTALVASLGFLPMALSTSSGAEVQRPLATVVIGGLLVSTLLTLVVFPIFYRYVEEGKFFRKIESLS